MLWGTNMDAMRMTVVVPKQPSWIFTAVCMPPGNLCTVTSSTAGLVAWHLHNDGQPGLHMQCSDKAAVCRCAAMHSSLRTARSSASRPMVDSLRKCSAAEAVNSRLDEVAALARKSLPLQPVQPEGHHLPCS